MYKERDIEYSDVNRLLKSITLSMDELISNQDIPSAVKNCLSNISMDVGIDHAELYLSDVGENGRPVFYRKNDNISDSDRFELNSQASKKINVEISDYLSKIISEKKVFNSNVEIMPEGSSIPSFLDHESILSSLVIPVYRREFIWGFLVFGNRKDKRAWTENEIVILRRFSESISKALERISDDGQKERLSLIARRNRLGVQITGPDMKMLYVNESLQRMTGFRKDELIGQNPYELLKGPKTKIKSIELLRNGHEKSYPIDIDIILYRKDKSWFWANVKQQILEDKTKRDKDFFSIIQDISEKKIVEEHVRNSRRRLTTLIQNIKAGILLEDENHRIVFANTSFCKMFNIDNDHSDPVGMDSSKVFRDISNLFIYPDLFLERYSQIITEGKYVPEEEWKVLENHIYECDYVPILNNDAVKGHLWKFTDITSRKNQEKILKQLESKYRNIIANMKMGLLEIDTNDTITYANLEFSEMSGYLTRDLIGKKVKELNIGDQFEHLLSDKTNGNQRGFFENSQILVRTKRGKAKWWLISSGPNYNDNGKLTGTVAISVDITEQKTLEQELEIARERAEESSKAKEIFLATMSHEIRTPLNVIIGMIRDISRESLSPTQDLFVKNASASGQHLLSIVNNILDITKIESGQIKLDNRPFNVADVIHEAILIMNPSAQEKMLDLTVTISEELKSVYIGDSNRIRQILLNILDNSVKFTDEGSISINCNVSRLNDGKDRILISITDTGIGIDDAFKENIFERFTQSDYSSSRKYGGAGMGMSISYELIQLMNGSINIDSKLGKGTTVEILIDLEISQEKESKLSIDRNVYDNLRDKKILLVEDSFLNRLVAANSLSYYGMNITEAVNGIDALEKLNKSSFDLILMDLQMPELGGLEATKIIRNEMRLNTPVIALTANVFKSELERCLDAGMDDYITKPFDESDLLAVLIKFLSPGEKKTDKSLSVINTRDEKLFDLDYIHEMSRGNKGFVINMIEIFCEESPGIISSIKHSCNSRNFLEMKRLAHRFKPTLTNFGIKSANHCIIAIEKFDETSQSASELYELILELENVTLKVVSQLKSKNF